MFRSIARRAGRCTRRHPLLISILSAVSALPSYAQGWIEMERPVDPALPPDIVRVGSEVRVTVDGRVARVEVEERFRNNGSRVSDPPGSTSRPILRRRAGSVRPVQWTRFRHHSGDRRAERETRVDPGISFLFGQRAGQRLHPPALGRATNWRSHAPNQAGGGIE
jgi:hypothetical protein